MTSMTLLNEWRDSMPGIAEQSEHIAQQAVNLALGGAEMEEIAASFDAANIPSGFLANAEVYRTLAGFKDTPGTAVIGRSKRPHPKSMSQLVTLINHGPVAVITIDNPPVNALSPGVPEDLASSIETAKAILAST